MKREYRKPSMAVNLFDATDSTNAVTKLSSITPLGTVSADRKGVAVINAGKLNS